MGPVGCFGQIESIKRQSLFIGDKNGWFNRFDHLTKVRNPIAHNNPGDITADVDLAKQYYVEIASAILTWKKSHVGQP